MVALRSVSAQTSSEPFSARRISFGAATPLAGSIPHLAPGLSRDTVQFGRGFKPKVYDQEQEPRHRAEKETGWFRRNLTRILLAATIAVGGVVGVSNFQANNTQNQLEQLEALHGSSQYAITQPDGSILVITSPFRIPADVMNRTAPASVEITSDTTPGYISIGSGVVIRDANDHYYLLTNNHVTQAPIEAGHDDPVYNIRLFGDDSSSQTAEVVSTNATLDMSLMRFTDPDFVPAHSIDVSRIRDLGDNPLDANEPVFEVGNPGGRDDTIMPGVGFNHSRYRDDSLEYLAGCFKGSSGSPIFDLDGNIVGLGKAISVPTGGRCFGVKGDDIRQQLEEWDVALT